MTLYRLPIRAIISFFVAPAQLKEPDTSEVSLKTGVNENKKMQHKRSTGKAVNAIGRAILNSGKAGLKWKRGRDVMKFLLKDTNYLNNHPGYPVYAKAGGKRKAMKDFEEARLHDVKVKKYDTYSLYTGWAGEVLINMKIIKEDYLYNYVQMTVEKSANDIRKGSKFVIYYTRIL